MIVNSSLIINQPYLKVFKGDEALKYWFEIANLRIDMFKGYPYFYEGTLNNEKEYLSIYFNSFESVMLLIFNNEEIIGFSSCIPLNQSMEEVKLPFIERGINFNSFLYIGELLIKQEYRDQDYMFEFLKYYNSYARDEGYNRIIFMTMENSPSDITRPKDYQALEPLWEYSNFKILEGYDVEISWLRSDSLKNEINHLNLFYNDIT